MRNNILNLQNKTSYMKNTRSISTAVTLLATVIVLIAFPISSFANKPIIGISSYDNGSAYQANIQFIKCVEKAGGIPFIIPVNTNDEDLKTILDMADGIIMTGGEDFSPLKWYGEEPRRELTRVNPIRDEFDVKTIRYAVAKGKPVLGICRGEQGLAVAFGGSLYQDIPTMIKGNIKHSQTPTSPEYPHHSITIEKGSLLHSLLKTEKIAVNSWHHQCIKDIPKGLKASAFAADGVVEAVERCGKIEGYEDALGWILGVQFHPELLVADGNYTEYLPIFEAFIKASAEYAAK